MHSWQTASRQFWRLLFIAGVTFLIAGCVLIVIGPRLIIGEQQRLLIQLGLLIPPLTFAASHLFLEVSLARAPLEGRVKARALATLCWLFVIPTIFAFRFELPFGHFEVVVRSIGIAILAWLLGLITGSAGSESPWREVAYYWKSVMWDLALGNSRAPFDVKRIRQRRQRYYREKGILTTFQETLLDSSRNAELIAEQILKFVIKSDLSILDIGSGEGTFTTSLVGELLRRGKKVDEVLALDPVDFSQEYVRRLGSVVDKSRLRFVRGDWQNFQMEHRFDLVIASHSLYDMCDELGGEPGAIRERVIAPILASLQEGGVAVIMMASGRGRSYALKTRALNLLYGDSLEDSTAETLSLALAGLSIEERVIDTAIYMEEMREGVLERWLSYFLRIDLERESLERRGRILELVGCMRQRVAELPEDFQREVISRLGIPQGGMVLTHKVVSFALPRMPLK